MQPGEKFMVVGHSMSTIYSTTTDIATFQGKVVLFTRDRKGTCKCVPIILPPPKHLRVEEMFCHYDKGKNMATFGSQQ
jgi:hypothetical protein